MQLRTLKPPPKALVDKLIARITSDNPWLGREAGDRLARLGAGELFGELSVADGEPRSASARATIDPKAKLLCIAKTHLEKLLDENPSMALTYQKGLVRKLTERLRKVDDAVHDFSRRLQHTWY